MGDWNGYGITSGAERWQAVLNQSWPLAYENGKRHARGIPNHDPIAVRVRVVFDKDGEQWLDGQALRWHGRCVYVEIDDPRSQTRGIWVDAREVKRRL